MWNFKLVCDTRFSFTRAGESLCDVNTDFKSQLQYHGVNRQESSAKNGILSPQNGQD